MFRYVLEFSKRGFIKYTSHLDLQRILKRAFRRSGIPLKYTQGYHPHPIMSLSQPLSLGYEAEGEWLEIETQEPVSAHRFQTEFQQNLPSGIEITRCGEIKEKKSIAACITGARYLVTFPTPYYRGDFPKLVEDYLAQEQILVMKKQKKKKEPIEVDIRGKIHSITAVEGERGKLCLQMELDCGSASNVSPELIISSFLGFSGLPCIRYEIEVVREELLLPLDYSIDWL